MSKKTEKEPEAYRQAIRERCQAEKTWYEQRLAARRKWYEALLLEKIKEVLPEGTKDIEVIWDKEKL